MRSTTEERVLIIRADADSQIGSGHVMRCLALAEAWRDRGRKATFLGRCSSAGIRQRIKSADFEFVSVDDPHPHHGDLATTLSYLETLEEPTVVLDGYHFDPEYQQGIRDGGHRLLVIDDLGDQPKYHADFLLNQNIGAPNVRYSVNTDAKLLLGPRYALLRSEFRAWSGWERPVPEAARRVLVTLGGADPDNATLTVVETLGLVDVPNLEVRVVVGPANPHVDSILQAVRRIPGDFQVLSNVANMPEHMAWANLAVAAGGSTWSELAFMGLPGLLFVLATNQVRVAVGMQDAGAAKNMGRPRDLSPVELAQVIESILADSRRLQQMSLSGRKLADGQGALRVVQALSAQKTREGPVCHGPETFSLRPASFQDCQMLLAWRNDPVMVSNSIHRRSIPIDEHQVWFERKIVDPACRLYVGEVLGQPVGHVRFEITGNSAEVSVVVAPEKRGCGYGTQLLENACLDVGNYRFVALVRPDNLASIKAFKKAGFDPVGRILIQGAEVERLEKNLAMDDLAVDNNGI